MARRAVILPFRCATQRAGVVTSSSPLDVAQPPNLYFTTQTARIFSVRSARGPGQPREEGIKRMKLLVKRSIRKVLRGQNVLALTLVRFSSAKIGGRFPGKVREPRWLAADCRHPGGLISIGTATNKSERTIEPRCQNHTCKAAFARKRQGGDPEPFRISPLTVLSRNG